MELTSQSTRMVYRQSLGATTSGMTVTVPGFDLARGAVFITTSGNTFGEVPLYTISDDVVAFHWNGSSGATHVPHAMMFS